MSFNQRLGALLTSICLANSLFAASPPGMGGSGTLSSADGQVQIQTDFPSGKVTILRPTPIEMEVINKRANDGDAAAQMILSEVQYGLKNRAEGERWLRKAVQTENIYAEFLLGSEFLHGIHGGVPRPDEAVIWLKLAAYEGYTGAQEELSNCYRTGLGVEKNELEGYAWLLISLRSMPRPGINTNKMLLRFEKLLSTDQIDRAKLRAKNFFPTVTERNPFVDAGWIRLKAISQSNGTPIALINDQAFTVAEQKKVTWVGKAIEVRCLEIRSDSVIVATEPYMQRGELRCPK